LPASQANFFPKSQQVRMIRFMVEVVLNFLG
jgi:hypothetical protein